MRAIITQQFSFWLVLATCLMHVFCCGLPLLFSLGSLATVVGFSGSEWVHPEWLEQYEFGLMAFSGAVLLFTGGIQYISSRINCRTDGNCAHAPCDKKKNYARHIYMAAVALFAANLALNFLTH